MITSLSLGFLSWGIIIGFLTREWFTLSMSLVLTVTRCIWMTRPDSGADEKYYFFYSYFLTIPALILRNPYVLLNSMNLLMGGRGIIFAMALYRVLYKRTGTNASFIAMAINNEGMLFCLRVIFQIVVDRTPEISENMKSIARTQWYF